MVIDGMMLYFGSAAVIRQILEMLLYEIKYENNKINEEGKKDEMRNHFPFIFNESFSVLIHSPRAVVITVFFVMVNRFVSAVHEH
jgi:hypothetical protein